MKKIYFFSAVLVVVLILLVGCIPQYSEYKKAKEAEKEAQQYAEQMQDAMENYTEAMSEAAKQDSGEDDTETEDTGGTGEEDSDGGQAEDSSGETGSTTSQTAEKVADESGQPIPEIIEYEIPADRLSQLKKELTQGTLALLLPTSYPSGLDVGESYVFAFGLTNMHTVSEEFKFEIEFKNARDMNNNAINGVDEETILSWVKHNRLENTDLDPYEQIFLPIGVTVGSEIAPGLSTVPGNYYFKLVSTFQHGTWYDDYDEKEFSFRVK
jgi:type II secretory pathway pseudopilin PulG